MIRNVVMVAALALIACAKKAPPVVESDAGGAASSSAAPVTSATRKRPPTTDWAIASGNLDGQIETYASRGLANAKDASTLVHLLLARGHFVARIADYEKADEIAQKLVSQQPTNADALRARASVHNALHRWDEATKDLDAAQKAGADPAHLAGTRGSIFMARGQYDEAAKYIREDASDPSDIATAGVLAGLRHKHDDAQRLFDAARAKFADVSPFPVAWMAFERARWLEGRGKTEDARVWYEEALDAIPVYAHAAVHVAMHEPPEKAVKRLEPLTRTSDDPDVLAALADGHRRAKNDDEAKKYAGQARARYDELVKKHSAAFADHAARFFLKEGDSKRALELAQANEKTRTTEESLDLLLGAATAANAKDEMCRAATKMNALVYISPERKRLAGATLTGCAAK